MFAFSGAQRTGKTTLAKAVAERLGFHYHDASTTRIAKEFGLSPVGEMSLEQRIDLQEFILKRFIEEVRNAPSPAICDRTPLDMIGYMLGEVTMHNTPPEHWDRIQRYVQNCIEAATKHFDMILVVRQLNHYTVDPDKPPPNIAYQTMVQYIIEGAAQQGGEYLNTGYIVCTGLEERIVAAIAVISDYMEHLAVVKETRTTH